MRARYVHTNVVARDWRALAAFYERAFGCVRVPPSATTAAPRSTPAPASAMPT